MTITDGVVLDTKIEDEVYVDENDDTVDDACAQPGFSDGEEVANGKHVVPKGVAVEELKNYRGHNALKNTTPEGVVEMLQSKGLMGVYDKFVESVYDEKTTRSTFTGKWKDGEFASILDCFRDDFADKGVKVVLCKRSSASGSYRWLEFIDVEVAVDYVPQYDVSNRSGQVIKTVYRRLQFPDGVAVEELKEWGGRKKLKERIPIRVEKMLEKYDLRKEYDQMVDHVIEAGVSSVFKSWSISKLKELMKVYQPMFKEKGVEIFVSRKDEWVSTGQGGYMRYFRWIEFVDRELQPNYTPQRDAETKDCTVM